MIIITPKPPHLLLSQHTKKMASKHTGETLSMKKFLKLFRKEQKFICLTDKESEEDEDYETGVNSNIVFTTPENFLLAVHHAKIPNVYIRDIKGFIKKTEIFINGYIFRASKISLTDKYPIAEASFLADTKFYKRMQYDHAGAKYLISNKILIPPDYFMHLIAKDDALVPYIPDITEEQIEALLTINPYLIKYFTAHRQYYRQVATKQPYTLQYLVEPDDDTIKAALKINGTAIKFIENPTPEQCLISIEQNYMALQDIPKHLKTQELIMKARELLKADDDTNIDVETLT